jgi:hypothetical protein
VYGIKEELDATAKNAKVGEVRGISMEEFKW